MGIALGLPYQVTCVYPTPSSPRPGTLRIPAPQPPHTLMASQAATTPLPLIFPASVPLWGSVCPLTFRQVCFRLTPVPLMETKTTHGLHYTMAPIAWKATLLRREVKAQNLSSHSPPLPAFMWQLVPPQSSLFSAFLGSRLCGKSLSCCSGCPNLLPSLRVGSPLSPELPEHLNLTSLQLFNKSRVF